MHEARTSTLASGYPLVDGGSTPRYVLRPGPFWQDGSQTRPDPGIPVSMDQAQQAQLLLSVLRGRWADAEEIARAGSPDPETFVDLCRECEVPTWTHYWLESNDRFDLVGQTVRDRLHALRLRIRNDNILLLARLEQAMDALAHHGVMPIMLKGTDTVHRFYGGFDRRTMVDVDLLVRNDELQAAVAAFEELGWVLPRGAERDHWVRSSHHLPLHSAGPVPVEFELHWNIVQKRRYSVDAEGLFQRAVPIEIAGRNVLRLEDHDFVAHLLLHHFSHYFAPGLKGLVDLRFISRQPDFDWGKVANRLREWNGTAAAAASFLHLRKLWPELIPDEILRMMPLTAWRRMMTWPLRSNHPLELYRHTRNRRVQLYLAGVMLEDPMGLPSWLIHRLTRDATSGDHPLDRT